MTPEAMTDPWTWIVAVAVVAVGLWSLWPDLRDATRGARRSR